MANKSNTSQAQRGNATANRSSAKKAPANENTTAKQSTAPKKNVKRSPNENTSASSAKAKRDAFERQRQEQKHNRRVWLAFAFFAIAGISILCLFNTDSDTILLAPLSRMITGLFGAVGKFLLPLLLIYIGVILVSSYGHPVQMRTWCAFFAVVFFLGIIHVIADAVGNCENNMNPGQLWKNALDMKSGGVIPGFIAQFLAKFISRVGAVIFMVIGMVLCGFATRSITPVGVVNAVKKRSPQPVVHDREDASEKFVERIAQVHYEKQVRKTSPKVYDLEVDDPPLLPKKTGTGEEKKTNKTSENYKENHSVKSTDKVVEKKTEKRWEWNQAMSPSEYLEQKENDEKRYSSTHVDMEKRQMTMDEVELHEPVEPQRSYPRKRNPAVVFKKDNDRQEEYGFNDDPPVFKQKETVRSDSSEYRDMEVEERTTEPVREVPPVIVATKKTTEQISKEEARAGAEAISAEIAEQEPMPAEYTFPTIDLLNRSSGGTVDATSEMRENTKRLADALQSFGVNPHIVDVIRGPSVTRYELELDRGVKLSKITNLSEDIALALGAQGVRISAIPDKISVVGIEVPNKIVNTVYAREVIGSALFAEKKSKVSFAVGKDISGNCIIGDIGKMPHMLIAGTTGSGKSVCMNTLIISLLYKARPDEVKMIMVDPKMVELGIYNGIPHLLIPVVTDPKKAAGALQWTVTEMLRRYGLMRDEEVRDLESYNKAVANDPDREKLPQVVVVIDELADLMLVAAKEVEESICRIAQMGRAAGIHLVIATQRPSADVITGTMKANIPSRIAFSVFSAMESRIILDVQGAEKLVGKGDMLFAPHGQGKPQRVQGCFITDDEVSRVVTAIKANASSNYSDEVMEQIEKRAEQGSKNTNTDAPAPPESTTDEMLPAAVEVILETGQASVSMLQRRLKLGYARAARIVDEMQEMGIVGQFEGAKPRQLLITREQWEQMKNGGADTAVPDEIP